MTNVGDGDAYGLLCEDIETTFADLIDGPLAHIPSGRFGANSARHHRTDRWNHQV